MSLFDDLAADCKVVQCDFSMDHEGKGEAMASISACGLSGFAYSKVGESADERLDNATIQAVEALYGKLCVKVDALQSVIRLIEREMG